MNDSPLHAFLCIQIFLRLLDGRTRVLHLQPSDTVDVLQLMVSELEGALFYCSLHRHLESNSIRIVIFMFLRP